MTSYCTNCGQAVLPDDSSCWHCGYKLIPQKRMEEEEKKPAGRMQWQRETAAGVLNTESLPAPLVVYAIVTAVVLLLTLVLLNRLSQPPLLQINPNSIPPRSWPIVTYGNYEFMLNLPPNWTYATAAGDSANVSKLESFMSELPYRNELFLPYSTLASDIEFLLVAYQEDEDSEEAAVLTPFIVVAQSTTLNQLSPEQAFDIALTAAGTLGYDVLQREIVDNANRSHVAVGTLTANLRCQQQFINGRAQTMLVALCASQRSYIANREVFAQIMNSFEYLKRTE